MAIVYRLSTAAEVRNAVAKFRPEQEHPWRSEVFGARALMAMQPAGALKKQIHGRELGHHQVEIEVETLFEDLGCDDYRAVGALDLAHISLAKIDESTSLAETGQGVFLATVALFERVARMEKHQFRFAVISGLGKETLQRQVHCLCAVHGVAYHGYASAAVEHRGKPLAEGCRLAPFKSDTMA